MKKKNQNFLFVWMVSIVLASSSAKAQEQKVQDPLPQKSVPEAPAKDLRSKWAVTLEVGPGFHAALDPRPPKEGEPENQAIVLPMLHAAAGVGFYAVDACQGISSKTCIDLRLHLQLSSKHFFFEEEVGSMLDVRAGFEFQTFFRSQRRVAWTFQFNLLYNHIFPNPGSSFFRESSKDEFYFVLSTGVLFPISKGVSISFRVEAYVRDYARSLWSFPLGVQYRF